MSKGSGLVRNVSGGVANPNKDEIKRQIMGGEYYMGKEIEKASESLSNMTDFITSLHKDIMKDYEKVGDITGVKAVQDLGNVTDQSFEKALPILKKIAQKSRVLKRIKEAFPLESVDSLNPNVYKEYAGEKTKKITDIANETISNMVLNSIFKQEGKPSKGYLSLASISQYAQKKAATSMSKEEKRKIEEVEVAFSKELYGKKYKIEPRLVAKLSGINFKD